MQVPPSIPVALLRVHRTGVASFEPEDYIGRNLGLIYVQLLTHPDQYTYWYEEDKEPEVQELVKASVKDAMEREITRRHILRTSPRKTRDPLTGPWGVQTTLSAKFHALANVVLKGKQIIKDDPHMVPPFRGWHSETRMSEKAHNLIQRVAAGEDAYHVLAEAEVKPFSVKVTDKQKQISDLEAEVNKATDADERALKQAKLDAARAELKHLQTQGPKDESTNSPIVVKTLGDVLGSLHYMGSCSKCRRQFMSRSERVATPKDLGKTGTWCLGCAAKLFPEAFDKFGRFIGENLQEGATFYQELDMGKIAQSASRLAQAARQMAIQKADISVSYFFIGVLQECQVLSRLIYVHPGSHLSAAAGGKSSSVNHFLEEAIRTIEAINHEMAKVSSWPRGELERQGQAVKDQDLPPQVQKRFQ